MAVIVNSVDRQSTWPDAHILKEILKTMEPPIAHENTAASVIFINLAVRVITSLFHAGPSAVFLGLVTLSILPMRHMRRFEMLSIETAAGFSAAKG